MPDIADGSEPAGGTNSTGGAAGTAREYIKALAFIAVIVGLVLFACWLVISGSCACLTRPAG